MDLPSETPLEPFGSDTTNIGVKHCSLMIYHKVDMDANVASPLMTQTMALLLCNSCPRECMTTLVAAHTKAETEVLYKVKGSIYLELHSTRDYANAKGQGVVLALCTRRPTHRPHITLICSQYIYSPISYFQTSIFYYRL